MTFIFVFVIVALSLAVTYDTVDERGQIIEQQVPRNLAHDLMRSHEEFFSSNETATSTSVVSYSVGETQSARDFQRFHFLVSDPTPTSNTTFFLSVGTFRSDQTAPQRYSIASELHKISDGDSNVGAIYKQSAGDADSYVISSTCIQQDSSLCSSPTLPSVLVNHLKAFTQDGVAAKGLLENGTPVIFQRRTPPAP